MSLQQINYTQIRGGTPNVKDFGAVGDGVTDDTIAFTNALGSYGVRRTVIIPAGTYLITSTIPLGIYKKLIGVGSSVVIINFNSSDLYAFTGDSFSCVEGFSLYNITPTGNQTALASLTPTVANGWRNGTIKDIEIHDFYYGIGSTQGLTQGLMFQNLYERVRIYDANTAILMGAGSNANTFINCEFWRSYNAITLNNATSMSFKGCGFEYSTNYDFYIDGTYNITFDTCYFESARGGVFIASTGVLVDCHSTNFAAANTNLVLLLSSSVVSIYNFTDYNLPATSVATQTYYKSGDGTGTVTCIGANVRAGIEKGPVGANKVSVSGIQFPATAEPSTNVNTLDDYAEGTFTPTIIGLTTEGEGTYSTQIGTYTKIGNLVTYAINLIWTAHTGTGTMRVSGLPFTVGGNINNRYTSTIAYSDLTYTSTPFAYAVGGTTLVYLRSAATGASQADLSLDVAASIWLTGSYQV